MGAFSSYSGPRFAIGPERLSFATYIVAGALALMLTGCAAFRGAPEAVVDTKEEASDLAPYLKGDVLQKSYASSDAVRGGLNPTQWRDAVIGARVELADQKYRAFKNELYAETTSINLGTGLAALGLSGAASVAGAGAAQALAAASTGVLGAGTTGALPGGATTIKAGQIFISGTLTSATAYRP